MSNHNDPMSPLQRLGGDGFDVVTLLLSQISQHLVTVLPLLQVQPVACLSNLTKLLARNTPGGRIRRVQHLPPVRHLESTMQFRQRQEPQSTTRHRCVEERGRRVGRQP